MICHAMKTLLIVIIQSQVGNKTWDKKGMIKECHTGDDGSINSYLVKKEWSRYFKPSYEKRVTFSQTLVQTKD